MLDQSTPRRTGELFRCIATRAGKWVAHLGSVIRDIAVYASQWLLLDRIKTKTRSICTQCPLVSPLLVGAVAPPEEEKPPLIVFLLGCPGAGKGTQSALLKAAFPGPPLLTHLSYGDLLRHVDRIPGSWVSAFPRRRGGTGTTTSSPHLPADAAVQLLRETIVEAGIRRHGQRVWLVDGSPRSDRHVAAWAAAARMPSAQLAIYLSCPPETLIRRVLDRGGSAASSFSSSSSSSSSLSTTAERRADDAVPELVRERVERNGREREALLAALAAAGVRVVRVDADRDVDAVGREVQAHFQKAMYDWQADRSGDA